MITNVILPYEKDCLIEFSEGLFNSLVLPTESQKYLFNKNITINSDPDELFNFNSNIRVDALNTDYGDDYGFSIDIKYNYSKNEEYRAIRSIRDKAVNYINANLDQDNIMKNIVDFYDKYYGGSHEELIYNLNNKEK